MSQVHIRSIKVKNLLLTRAGRISIAFRKFEHYSNWVVCPFCLSGAPGLNHSKNYRYTNTIDTYKNREGGLGSAFSNLAARGGVALSGSTIRPFRRSAGPGAQEVKHRGHR
jgi:hypothetical protein